MRLPTVTAPDGLPRIVEPTDNERARLRATLRTHEPVIRDLWEAATNLHRAYDQTASYGSTPEHSMRIRTAEDEYDRLRHLKLTLRQPHTKEDT